MAIDFYYYFLSIKKGNSSYDLPGAVVATGFHKAHRHRRGDLFALLITYSDDSILSDDKFIGQAQELIKLFYRSSGSVTNAIQLVAGELNRTLLDYNLQTAEGGEQVTAVLNIAVLHRDHLFIGHSGNTQTFVIKRETIEQYCDRESLEKPLGLNRRMIVQYRHVSIDAGDIILLCPKPPLSWTNENLLGSTQISMEQVKRKLLNQVTDELRAVVIKCREGEGKAIPGALSIDRSMIMNKAGMPEEFQPNEKESLEVEESDLDHEEQKIPIGEGLNNEKKERGAREFPATDLEIELTEEQKQEQLDAQKILVKPGQTEISAPQEDHVPEERDMPAQNHVLIFIARAWLAWKNLYQKVNVLMKKINQGIFPHLSLGRENVSPAIALFLSIALPAILITVSLIVYNYSGKHEQHDNYLVKAQEYATLAVEQEDPMKQREYWAQANEFVNKALDYGQSDESKMLSSQSQSVLDEMDLVTRLEFRPALIEFLPEGTSISKIKANTSGVYLLNNSSGNILRIFVNKKGYYEIDSNFQCGPGEFGLSHIGQLVDFVLLPANTRDYKIMAIDKDGNLLYCSPGEAPSPSSLIPSDDGWGRLAEIAIDGYTLYVVDTDNDMVWFYKGKDFESNKITGVVFRGKPESYLDNDLPDLGGFLAISVNQDDAYILHQDSHMTICQYNAYKENDVTECQDPAPYSDNRPGHEKNPLIYIGASFVDMQNMRYPDASLYILDAANQAIMQFSYQLNLEHVMKPQPSRIYPLPDSSPTAFGVSLNKEIFLAYDNQLFVTVLP